MKTPFYKEIKNIMIHYNKKTFFGNRYSLDKLIEFRNLLIDYSNNIHHHPDLPPIKRNLIENQKATNIRTEINKNINSISKILLEAGLLIHIVYRFPPATGGGIENIDLLNNIFNLKDYNISLQQVVDIIDRGIGIYSDDKISSIIRLFNPLFWLVRFLDFIVNIPFRLLQKSGFNTQKAEENSFFVKIIKFIFYLISLSASTLTVLHLLGYLEKFKNIL